MAAVAAGAVAVIGAGAVIVASPVSAAPTDVLLLATTSDAGVKGNATSDIPFVSADGTAVAFSSNATNLDPADTDPYGDVYLKDLASGDIQLISTSATGVKGNGSSGFPHISDDGSTVVFSSTATNLHPDDTDGDYDVYVKDLASGDLVLASTSEAGINANAYAFADAVSADGSTVAFSSYATNLDPADTDPAMDVYLKNVATGVLVLASTSDAGVKGDGASQGWSLSADGSKVAFSSRASNLDPADTDTIGDAYVKDVTTGDIVLASTSDTGVKSNADILSVMSLSADGSRLAFFCAANTLDPADTDGSTDVYVKDLVSGDIVLASTSDTGVTGNGYDSGPSLSADGGRVAFTSESTNLDPGDTNAVRDVYVKTLATGDVVLSSTSSSGVKGNGPSAEASLSADGSAVAFVSDSTNLVAADTDTVRDVYVKTSNPVTPAVTVSIGDRVRSEGDDGRTRFAFHVTLSQASPTAVTVEVSTADGSAVAGSDYFPRSGSRTFFAAGQTKRTVVVWVVGDTAVEPREQFTISVSNPSGATIADGTGIGTIRNDDTEVGASTASR